MNRLSLILFIIFSITFGYTSCTPNEVSPTNDGTHTNEHLDEEGNNTDLAPLQLPPLASIELNDGEILKVVATTSIIGDVVAQVGGDAIELTTLIQPGQDPHSFEPSAQDLTAVSQADIIIVNGWNLEESLIHDLEDISEDVPIVPISANIIPLAFGDDARHNHEEHTDEETERDNQTSHTADPHVWMSIDNVTQWVKNGQQILTQLDPANAETYERNATAYLAELEQLAEYAMAELGQIPAEKRFLVTNHDAFAYFGHEYGFTVLGTVIPGISTMAEPSAINLAELIEEMQLHDVCTIFTETTVNDSLAQTVASELNNCDQVQIEKLYSGAIGAAGSDTDNYLKMMRVNIDTITNSLANQ